MFLGFGSFKFMKVIFCSRSKSLLVLFFRSFLIIIEGVGIRGYRVFGFRIFLFSCGYCDVV